MEKCVIMEEEDDDSEVEIVRKWFSKKLKKKSDKLMSV